MHCGDRVRDRMLALLWILTAVPPALPQPPLPLSLPVQMSVVPPPWRYVPLSQAELGPLFSNSSPFSFSQSLLLVPPPGQAAKPGIRASFGPYSVTQLMSEAVVPLSPPLLASLLSGGVVRERGEGGEERYRVRALFHVRGNGSSSSTGATCITLHAFKDTQEHKASCVTQPPLGLCMVTLTLPRDWFESDLLDQPYQGLDQRLRHVNQHHRAPDRQSHHRRRGSGVKDRTAGAGDTAPLRQQPGLAAAAGGGALRGGALRGGALRYLRGPTGSHIQLYYSSFGPVSNLKQAAPRCVEDRPQSQRELFNMGVVTLREEQERTNHRARNRTKEEEACLKGREEEELMLDPHVLIRYHKGPVLGGQTAGVSVNLRANFSSEFVVIRLKVKKGLVSMLAQRTLTSDLWVVTLDRSHVSKHDIISIICHKRGPLITSVLQQVACLSLDGLRRSFGVAMTVTANWWVEYSGRNNIHSAHGAAVSTFSFADRQIVGIAPLTESNTIINTAILTGEHVSLPVIALAVAHDGQVSDVTTVVRCRSTNEDIIKVSSDCSTLFVDGSESGMGSTCARVEFQLGMLSGSVCVSVWAPSVPLRVSLSDPVLNAIVGWNHLTENGCSPLFQRSTVQVLTQFTAQDAQGDTTHLLGSSDWFVDVTELLHSWLRVENPQVAVLGERGTVVGLRPGRTSLHVISEQWDGVLGSCDVTVSSEAVTLGDLSVQVVGGLGMSVKANPAHPAVVTTTVTAYNILYEYGQEASISTWLQFSDDTSSLLSSFDGLPFSLRLSSLADTVVVVTPGRVQRVIAQGDGGGPLLRAELLVCACVDPPVTSNSIFGHGGAGGGGEEPSRPPTRRLARGSGWIRVNLDSDFLRPMGSEDGDSDDFEYDISDMLVESDGGVYVANFDGDPGDNATADEYHGRAAGNSGAKRGAVAARNNLERAALMPKLEESDVYFSPSQERGGGGGGRRDKERELEVGAGVVLSLLCLSTVLFLANCLPCAVRERRRRRKAVSDGEKEEGRGETEGGAQEEQGEEEEWPRRKVDVIGQEEEEEGWPRRKVDVIGQEEEEEEWQRRKVELIGQEEEQEEEEGEEKTEEVEDVEEVEIVC